MAVILPASLLKREFPKGLRPDDEAMLRRASRIPPAEIIKGESLPPHTRLLKVYTISSDGPRRIVWLLQVAEGDLFFLFCRDKNDPVGKNIPLKNSEFRDALKRHLKLLAADIESGAWEELETESEESARPPRPVRPPVKKKRRG